MRAFVQRTGFEISPPLTLLRTDVACGLSGPEAHLLAGGGYGGETQGPVRATVSPGLRGLATWTRHRETIMFFHQNKLQRQR